MKTNYKGFEISSSSIQSRESNEWTTKVVIRKHTGKDVLSKSFSASNTFKTQTEADDHSVNFGKEIIDEKHKGLSFF